MKFKRSSLQIILLIGGISICSIIGLMVWRSRNAITIQRVNKMIQESLPLGSSETDVTTFLNSEGIESSYLDGKKIDLNSVSSVSHSGIPIERIGGVIMAIIRGTSRRLFISGDIQIVFFFDKQNKLIKYTVEEVFTGP